MWSFLTPQNTCWLLGEGTLLQAFSRKGAMPDRANQMTQLRRYWWIPSEYPHLHSFSLSCKCHERFSFRLKFNFSLEKGERKVHFEKKNMSQVDADRIFPWFNFCSVFSPRVDFDNILNRNGTPEQHVRKIAFALELQQHRLLWLNFLMLPRGWQWD